MLTNGSEEVFIHDSTGTSVLTVQLLFFASMDSDRTAAFPDSDGLVAPSHSDSYLEVAGCRCRLQGRSYSQLCPWTPLSNVLLPASQAGNAQFLLRWQKKSAGTKKRCFRRHVSRVVLRGSNRPEIFSPKITRAEAESKGGDMQQFADAVCCSNANCEFTSVISNMHFMQYLFIYLFIYALWQSDQIRSQLVKSI